MCPYLTFGGRGSGWTCVLADKGLDAHDCCLVGEGVDGLAFWQIRGWMPVTVVWWVKEWMDRRFGR